MLFCIVVVFFYNFNVAIRPFCHFNTSGVLYERVENFRILYRCFMLLGRAQSIKFQTGLTSKT